MSKSFEPRQVDPQALKRWAKDSGVLLGRLGAPWIIAWGLCLPLLAVGVDKAIGGNHLLAFPAFFLMQMIGVVCQPLLQQALDRAAEGHRPGLAVPAALAAHELASNRQWLMRRARGQVMGLFFLLSIMVFIAFLAMNASTAPTDAPASPHPLNRAGTLMVFLVAVPLFLRSHGLFDFSYWLEVRHGADQQITQTLHDKAKLLNARVIMHAVFMFAGAFMLLTSHPVMTLMALPALQLFLAAFTRCAYHDIFEGGTGVKDKVAVEASDTHLVPILQA